METPDAMQLFVSIVKTGSFTSAGKALGLPKSTVSRRLSDLEHRLGVQLLRRTTRKISPTEVGQVYYENCRRIVADIDEAEQAIREMQSVPRGLLRIAAPPIAGRTPFIEVLVCHFLREYPEVEIELVAANRYVDLTGEGFDLAIRAGKLADSSLVARQLVKTRHLLVAAPKYLKKNGTPKSPIELQQHKCLLFRRGDAQNKWPLHENGFVTVSPRLISNDMGVIREACLQGLGLALLPETAIVEDVVSKQLRPLLCDQVGMAHSVSVVYSPSRYVSAKVRAFVEFAVNHTKELVPPSLPNKD